MHNYSTIIPGHQNMKKNNAFSIHTFM